MRSFDFIAIALGMRSPTMNFGGGGGSTGPTLQQQQLQTEQALTNANLNLEENSQRKSILNAMLGTRVFRGSALSRAVAGNTPGTGGDQLTGAPSASQTGQNQPSAPPAASLLDTRQSQASGSSGAGGVGGSSSVLTTVGARFGGSIPGRIV